jgi:hypothetical protein
MYLFLVAQEIIQQDETNKGATKMIHAMVGVERKKENNR